MTTHYPHSYPIPQTEPGLPLPTPELLAKEAAAGVIPISFPAIAMREDDVFQIAFLGVLELEGNDVIVEPFADKAFTDAARQAAWSFEGWSQNGFTRDDSRN